MLRPRDAQPFAPAGLYCPVTGERSGSGPAHPVNAKSMLLQTDWTMLPSF